MSEYCKEKVEGFIPELAESEDEIIKKELLDYLEERRVVETLTDTRVKEEWIAWLEKQGEKFKAEKQALIDKACEWLRNVTYFDYGARMFAYGTFINDFKQAMEGEQ